MDIPHKLLLFSNQILAGYGMSTWCFGKADEPYLFYTNCPHRDELLVLLRLSGSLEYIYGVEEGKPVLFTDALGMVWVGEWTSVEKEFNGLLFVIGPVLYSHDISRRLDETLNALQYSDALRESMREIVHSMPVVEPSAHVPLALMLHVALTDEILTTSDCVFQAERSIEFKEKTVSNAYDDGAWKVEAGLMRIIREGDVNALKEQEKNILVGSSLDLNIHDPTRSVRDALIIFTALCGRAAMQGGLSAQVTASMEQHYLTVIETTDSVTALINLRFTVIRDFTQRVSSVKCGPKHSKGIRDCCAYIQTHLTQELTIQEIARHVGYAEYYLTKKFQRETGVKLSEYIKQQRIEYAKLWLLTTSKSIQQISDELCFSNRNYFGKVFQKQTGMSPAAFRAQTQSGHAKEEEA